MSYLFWSLPTLVIAGAIGICRLNATYAALLGLIVTVPVAIFTGATPFHAGELAQALARGAWIGATIAPYILGGLLFWQLASQPSSAAPADAAQARAPAGVHVVREQRRLLFFACFLVGPFAEAATGFGVGMVGTIALLRGMRIAPRHLMVFGLLSQTMIPWGAMSSGTLLAAAYARMDPTTLALYTMIPTALLMPVWLALFWRTARQAGIPTSRRECLREAGWVGAGLALVTVAVVYLGPETSLLAVYGPLIVLRYLADSRPGRSQFLAIARRMLPYVALIAVLVATRISPGLKATLAALGSVAPFPDLPAWSPFLHAGSWLIAGGILTAMLRGHAAQLPRQAQSTWATGKHAVLTVFLFAMMAEVLASAGISQAFARQMFALLHQGALFVAPLCSAAFGILSNSGNMPNSLFMSSQTAVAVQAGLSVPAVAALQHVSGTSMSLFSPVRMSIAAGLAHGRGQERHVYAALLPYALAALALIQLMALWVALSSGAPGP